ncbi:retrovirus-related pol polyprotein from transposon TNT 1-94 [Tanacetum coccineum]
MNVVTRSNGQKRSFSTLIRVLSVFDREDLDAIYKLMMDTYQDKIPEGFDKVLWGDLIVMFNPDEQDEFWNSQHEWKVVSWKLHSSSGVHTLMTDEGLVVHMLIEKKYPLKKEILMQMLKLKLESEEESTMALELIRFIKKSWLVQDQTVLGKDYSNLLIADSLLKTIWFINAPCYDNEALASPNTNDEELSIPEQTATGKGTSNPLMADGDGSSAGSAEITPIHLYKLKKTLYGLKQAPRVWYDMLSSFLLSQDFSKGLVDPTLFIHREGKELLLISQSPRGIFINQLKYALESLKKYGFNSCDPVDTPMVEKYRLNEDKEGKVAWPTEKHLHAVKRIFRYLKGTVNRGLSYPKDTFITLIAFADADHVGCEDIRRSTSGSMQFLGDTFVSWSSKR